MSVYPLKIEVSGTPVEGKIRAGRSAGMVALAKGLEAVVDPVDVVVGASGLLSVVVGVAEEKEVNRRLVSVTKENCDCADGELKE